LSRNTTPTFVEAQKVEPGSLSL